MIRFPWIEHAKQPFTQAQLMVVGNVATGAVSGIGIGSVIAIVCSWERNKSIVLAALSGLFSWLYVISFALSRGDGETKTRIVWFDHKKYKTK